MIQFTNDNDKAVRENTDATPYIEPKKHVQNALHVSIHSQRHCFSRNVFRTTVILANDTGD